MIMKIINKCAKIGTQRATLRGTTRGVHNLIHAG